MKYIKNNGRYAVAFTIVKGGREVKIAFDRRRVYMDTGNIATSGITELEDADLAELKKLKHFARLLKIGEFEEVKGIKATDTDNTNELVKAKDAEIAEKDSKIAEKDNEIKSLKAELEALKTSKNENNEAEGF